MILSISLISEQKYLSDGLKKFFKNALVKSRKLSETKTNSRSIVHHFLKKWNKNFSTHFQIPKATSYPKNKPAAIIKKPLVLCCCLNETKLLVHRGEALIVATTFQNQLKNVRSCSLLE